MGEATLAFRFGLGALFLLSGVAKFSDLRGFEGIVREYRLVPAALTRASVVAIPAAETVLGLCLLLGIAFRLTGGLVAGLLLLFSLAILVNLVRGQRLACGCLGTVSKKEISSFLIVRNLILLTSALAITVWRPSDLSVDGVALMITGTLAAFALMLGEEALSVVRARRLKDVPKGTG